MYKDTQLNINKCNKINFLNNFYLKKVFLNVEGEGSMDEIKLSSTRSAISGYAPQQAKVQQRGLTKIGLAGTPPNLANINCELTPVHKGGDLGNILDFSC